MKILSCFDGISACQQALTNLKIKYDSYFSSEIDPYAIKVTQANFPETTQLGDIKKLGYYWDNEGQYNEYRNGDLVLMDDCAEEKYVGKLDLLTGGSPCQSFSVAGNQKGFEDERGQLFWEYVRILKEVKPKFFIFENVNSMKQRDKDIISKAFGFEPTVFNSALVTAQQRKRLYYVGKLQNDGTYAKVDVPLPQDRGILLKDILESGLSSQDKSYCLTVQGQEGLTTSGLMHHLEKRKDNFVFEPLCVASRGRNIVGGKRVDIKGVKTEQRLEPNLNGKTNCLTTVQKDNLILEPLRLGHFNKGGQGDRIYSVQGKSVCLSANGGGRGARTGLYKIDLPDGDYIIRKLSITECCRLQGFSDDYFIQDGKPIISNSQAYKCLGNSFTVSIVEHILKYLFVSNAKPNN
jgi:DNA (cytosine-5)-methyltransferase 3A